MVPADAGRSVRPSLYRLVPSAAARCDVTAISQDFNGTPLGRLPVNQRWRQGGAGPADDDSAPLDGQAPLGEELDGQGVDFMLHGEDAPADLLGAVFGADGYRSLDDDRPVVDVLVDEVHGRAGDLDPVVEGLALGIEALEGGQEPRVDVHDAEREGLE